jgi:signal transduction histidine kinase
MVRLADAFASMRRTLSAYEARLRESERVRGAQETARFVAHEIRNTLTPVRASLSVLETQMGGFAAADQARARRALDLIRREADRMASLAGAFSEYARFPERIVLSVERPPGLPRVKADREEMERIFRNLVKNAVEAIEAEGRLRVGFHRTEEGLEVQIEDTGCGMDEETLRKAFQPGFTTKAAGSGLGLALVRRSLSHYGGTIRVESRPGAGTACRVRLPAAPDEGEN